MIKVGKEYKIHSVKKGISQAGKSYTILKISDSIKDANSPNGWARTYYSLFVFDDLAVTQNGKISFGAIDGVKYSISDFNGKTYVECTIFVNKEFIGIGEQPEQTKNEEEQTPWGNDELPF